MTASFKVISGAILFLCCNNHILDCVVTAERVHFNDSGIHEITQDYLSHNIFVLNGTTLSLVGGHSIIAADFDSSSGDLDAVRVEDSLFFAREGVIRGGLGVGGAGVTVTTNRDSESGYSKAEFEEGVEVYGGDAIREKTSRGGDAVQILQQGSEAVFHGGKFHPGKGCTIEVCGVETNDGNSIEVLSGKAIVKGGSYTGNFYSLEGTIEVHGCVEYNEGKITGVLLDGSAIDVTFLGSDGDLSINFNDTTCLPASDDGETEISDSGASSYATQILLFTVFLANVFVLFQ